MEPSDFDVPPALPSRAERMMIRLRRVLNHEFSVGGLIELGCYLMIPYLCVGMAWAVVHPDQVQQIQARIERVSPAGADLAAWGLTMALWPASLQIAAACPVT